MIREVAPVPHLSERLSLICLETKNKHEDPGRLLWCLLECLTVQSIFGLSVSIHNQHYVVAKLALSNSWTEGVVILIPITKSVEAIISCSWLTVIKA